MPIKRLILSKLLDDLNERQATILVGARQVGKTFLLHAIEDYARQLGRKTAFFDLEQPDTIAQFNKPDSEIIKLLSSAGKILFIDEFHYMKNASHIFKALYDKGEKVKIFASGSSSLEIHKHLKESLAGRKFTHRIPPCFLSEIQQVIDQDPFDYYCKYGALPGTTLFAEETKKKMYLEDVLQSYLLKDVKSLIKEENIRAFNNLLYLLAQYQGSTVAIAGLANEVGLTARTIENYLEILAQTYVLFPLFSFSLNYGNELKKTKKYYFYDLGIRNILLKNFADLATREDAGKIVESFVFNQLFQQLSPENDIRFWRLKDGAEVDFIWIKNQKFYPIEVKLSCNDKQIPEGLKSFLKKYPKTQKAFVANGTYEAQVYYQEIPVSFIKWDKVENIPSLV